MLLNLFVKAVVKLIFPQMGLRSYLYIILSVRRIYCSENEQFYVKLFDSNDRNFTNTLLKNGTASSNIHCAGLCNLTPGCQDFTFNQNNCKLYGVNNNSQQVQNMTAMFEKANFTATTLPSGITFTYALIQEKAAAIEVPPNCTLLGGRVLMINSVEKLEHIRSELIKRKALLKEGEYFDGSNDEFDYWVDGYRLFYNFFAGARAGWQFLNGESIPDEVWLPGYPDSTDVALCVQMWYFIDYYLDDCHCLSEQKYICEK